MTKKLLFVIVLLSSLKSMAQENPQFTHFLFNRLSYNPAYAGSKDVMSIQALYRHQWQGINGAPRTALLGAHLPFANGRCGAGLQITQDQLGLLSNTIVDGMYAYRMKTGANSTLSLGVQARMEYSRIAWSQAKTTSGIDNQIPTDDNAEASPNFGMGVYFQAKQFFIGFSIPMFLESSLYRGNSSEIPDYKRLRTNYLMAGGEFPIGQNVDILPGMLVSYNPNAPLEMEWNVNVLFSKFLLLGLSYRMGDSMDGLIGLQLNKQMRMGLSYDLSLTELRQYHIGSFEAMVEYNFIYSTTGVSHLRYF